MDNFASLLVLILATYTLTRFLSRENGPRDSLEMLRYYAGRVGLRDLLECPKCLSWWVALLITIPFSADFISWFMLTAACSGGSLIAWRIVHGPFTDQREGDT